MMVDPVEEFIGQQLHSISNVDAGMMPKKVKGSKPWRWWPYHHHKSTKSFNIRSHEDRLVAAIDKKLSRQQRRASRQEEVQELLEKGYRKKEIAEELGVSTKTIQRDVHKLRLAWESKKSRM